MILNEIKKSGSKIEDLKKFVSWACDRLDIENMPTVKYGTDLSDVKKRRTFGSTSGNGNIWVHIANRNTADTMRTLCHELIHHKQFEIGTAYSNMSKEQTQAIEDEANAIAGRMMRDYGAEHEEIYESVAISKHIQAAIKEITIK
jgi:Zn-dependent peptidase ImmA (M78 family)